MKTAALCRTRTIRRRFPRASVPLRATRDRANERDRVEYRTAIVDEAQDMSLVGMQLVRALIAGNPGNDVPPDGLPILDDAAQRVYASGFRLHWAGIQVTGRSEILQTNYRNTKPVVEAAKAVRGDTLPVREDNDNRRRGAFPIRTGRRSRTGFPADRKTRGSTCDCRQDR